MKQVTQVFLPVRQMQAVLMFARMSASHGVRLRSVRETFLDTL